MVSLNPDLERQLDAFVENGICTSREDVISKALAAFRREREEIAAIQEGLDDIEAGRHFSLEEVDHQMRDQYGIEL